MAPHRNGSEGEKITSPLRSTASLSRLKPLHKPSTSWASAPNLISRMKPLARDGAAVPAAMAANASETAKLKRQRMPPAPPLSDAVTLPPHFGKGKGDT